MKTAAAAAALSSLLLSLVSAAPVDKRGDNVVWVTQTDIFVETVYTTTTLYVDPQPSSVSVASATAVGGEFYEKPHFQQPSNSAPPAAPSVYSAPAIPSSQAPPAPVQTSSPPPPPPPPAPTSSYVAPAAPSPAPPVSSVAPPAPPAPAPAPVQSSYAPEPAAPSPKVAAVSSGGSSFTGDMTYYDVGMGSCGVSSSPSEDVVAIDYRIMANAGNPNANPKCGKTITIKNGGQTASAKVVDTCAGCNPNAIDVPPSLFKKVAPDGDGRVHNIEWWFN